MSGRFFQGNIVLDLVLLSTSTFLKSFWKLCNSLNKDDGFDNNDNNDNNDDDFDPDYDTKDDVPVAKPPKEKKKFERRTEAINDQMFEFVKNQCGRHSISQVGCPQLLLRFTQNLLLFCNLI